MLAFLYLTYAFDVNKKKKLMKKKNYEEMKNFNSILDIYLTLVVSSITCTYF